jgi:hypothetical protein
MGKWAVLGMAMVLVGCASPSASSRSLDGSSRPRPEAGAFAPGELLVVFTPDAAEAVERARQEGRLPMTGLASLDTLMTTYGVRAIEPVFAHAPSPEAIKEKFPQRARRAPPGAALPDLGRHYRLVMNPVVPVEQAVAAFRADPGVESASPNYTVSIMAQPEAGS